MKYYISGKISLLPTVATGGKKNSFHFSLYGTVLRNWRPAGWNGLPGYIKNNGRRWILGLMSRLSRAIFLLLSAFSVISCSTVADIPDYTDNHKIPDVPFFPQETYQCGPASLAGVLNYWGIKISPVEISQKIFSESARGTLNLDMVLFAKSKGLNANQYAGGLNDLKKNIISGYPVIVLVDYGVSVFERNHFMVVTGYNNKGFIVNSGAKQDSFISNEEFQKAWKKAHYWTLLIRPE